MHKCNIKRVSTLAAYVLWCVLNRLQYPQPTKRIIVLPRPDNCSSPLSFCLSSFDHIYSLPIRPHHQLADYGVILINLKSTCNLHIHLSLLSQWSLWSQFFSLLLQPSETCPRSSHVRPFSVPLTLLTVEGCSRSRSHSNCGIASPILSLRVLRALKHLEDKMRNLILANFRRDSEAPFLLNRLRRVLQMQSDRTTIRIPTDNPFKWTNTTQMLW